MMERMVGLGTVCLRALGGARSGELRMNRFLGNDKVTVERIIDSWSDRTVTAVAERHVLAIQDTSAITFETGRIRRRDLGALNQGNAHGVLAHVMIAVDADTGACLGPVGGTVWNRTGPVTVPHHDRALNERESRRWVDTLTTARSVLARAAMVTVVGDREADMYPLWVAPGGFSLAETAPEWPFHILSRVSADRAVVEGRSLFAVMAALPVALTRTLELPSRQPGAKARTAKVAIRFGCVEIRRPHNEMNRALPKTTRLSVIEVRELDPPPGVEPILWRLATTHAVTDIAKTCEVIGWYKARWIIEQLFRAMKSQGLGLEDSQVETAERLRKLSAIAVKAACLTMQLVQERDGAHGRPASDVFDAEEMATIEALVPTLEGSTARQRNPHPRASLAWASWVMARLGGWNCYYKPPGPITIGRGLERFQAIHLGKRLVGEPT
jgi:hypothetical protein